MKTDFLTLTTPQPLRLEYAMLPCQAKSHGNLIFFHGGGATLFNYLDEIKYLSQFFAVYAFTIPGFGRSSTVDRYSLELLLEVTAEFVAQLKIANPILLGHSFGAGLAAQYALYTDKVRLLVLVAPLLFPVSSGAIETALNIQKQKQAHRKYRGFGSLVKILKRGLYYSLKQLISAVKLHNFLRQTNLGQDLEKLKVPVLAFIGERDIVLSAREQLQVLATLKQAQIVRYQDEGHLLFRTKLSEITDIVLAKLEA